MRVKGLWLCCMISLLPVVNLAAADLRLVEAARQGDKETVRSLLRQRVDINSSQPDGATAVAWAAYRDDLEIADLLIAAKANVNTPNDYGITPLFLACTNASAAMVDKLLKAGANPNAASEFTGETPIIECSTTGSVEAVKVLLAGGANVNAKDTRQGHTALMWAVVQKHLDVAKALLDGGADVNGRAKSGFTALMFAAQQGNIDAAKMLVAAGADVNAATNQEGLWQGDTALLLASLSGHEALSIFLLDQHADPDAADEYGVTTLHFSVLSGLTKLTGAGGAHLNRPPMMNLVKALLAHGANPNVRIKSPLAANKFARAEASPHRPLDPTPGLVSPVGATPFLLAAFNFDVNLMKVLAAGGADPLLGTEENVTPLMVTATIGAKAYTNLAGDQGKRALEAVKLAVELGGDVSAADNVLGLTALHGAASSASDDIIKFLVEKGANLNARDKGGRTPLDVVKDAQDAQGGAGLSRGYVKWTPTKELLLKAGATPLPPGSFKDESDPPKSDKSAPQK